MKRMKTGFSLAELLIGLVIAAIIATMGMSVAKKGIETSYDAYIYTGYKGIMDAIAEANAGGHMLEYTNVGNCAFMNDVISMFKVKDDNISTRTSNSIEFTAPNGISYDIRTSGTTGSAENDNLKHYYTIKISFPTPNIQSDQTRRNATFVYAPDDDYGILLPIPGTPPANGTDPNKTSLWNIANRKDLLMFYIDDGHAGRIGANGKYNKRDYYSLNDAICKTGKIIAVTDISFSNPDPQNGIPNLDFTSIRTLFEFDPDNPLNDSIMHKKINDCSTVGRGNTVGVIRPMNPRNG